MLSNLQHFRQSRGSQTVFEFWAAGPTTGPLAERLNALEIPLVSFQIHADGIKLSQDELQHQMASVLDSVKPDLIHSNSLSMSRNVGRMADGLFQNRLRTGHLRDIIKLSRTAIKDLNRNDGLVAVSDATRDFHLSRGLNRDICQTIYNGVDMTVFQPTDRTALRRRWFPQLPDDAIVLLNVGQICLRKGQKDLADAVIRLLPDFPQLHLVLAGTRHSTKAESVQYEQSILKVFAGQGLQNHLHLLGYQSQISQIMNASDVIVHAAKQEPLGRVLLEAASCERPIIATNVGGTSEILVDGVHARLVSPDVDSLALGIRDFLTYPSQAKNRAAAARKRIQMKFSVANAAQELASFWNRQLLAGRPGHSAK